MMVWEENSTRKALRDDERMASTFTRHIFSIKRILEILRIVHLIVIVVIFNKHGAEVEVILAMKVVLMYENTKTKSDLNFLNNYAQSSR